MTRLIGLLGGKGSGKTTIASYLAMEYGAKIYGIANELKELLRVVFTLSEEQLHGTQAQKETIDPRWSKSPRQLMELTGDGLAKVFGKEFLVERVLNRIRGERPRIAVISDVRYAREADLVRLFAYAGRTMLWRLHYPKDTTHEAGNHATEQEWQLPFAEIEMYPEVTGVEKLLEHAAQACQLSELVK